MEQQAATTRFVNMVRVFVSETESLTTVWVRLEGWPRMTRRLTWIMQMRPLAYRPNVNDLTEGMLVAVPVQMNDYRFFERARLLERTKTGFNVMLIDWGMKQHHEIDTIRTLPSKFVKPAPWVIKINLRGVQTPDQSEESLNPELAMITMRSRRGCLLDVHHTPEGTTARLLLDCAPGQLPVDIGAHWLELGYVIPKEIAQ
jgi:hypothetical protein